MTTMHPQLILASTSRYRAALLQRLGRSFTTADPSVAEDLVADEDPESRARRLSCEKALAVAKTQSSALTIGSDQVASLDGLILRKPVIRERALEQLSLASNREMTFFTGVALCQGSRVLGQEMARTVVKFRRLSQAQITAYVDKEPAFDCAGSFRWEGLGISLFEWVHSEDPTALEGLPLILCTMLLNKNRLPPI